MKVFSMLVVGVASLLLLSFVSAESSDASTAVAVRLSSANGAVALDGTPPLYYIRKGKGDAIIYTYVYI